MTKEPITKSGFDLLKKNLEKLKNVERPRIVDAIKKARVFGDLRENAEYHAAKEKQGIVEGRIAQLQGILARSRVVEVSKIKSTKIVFGATVQVLDVARDQKVTYRIVGEDESDSRENKISFTSPLGKALIGKEEGDTVIVKAPKGDVEYEIESFEFVD